MSPHKAGSRSNGQQRGYLPFDFPPGRCVSAEAATDLTAAGVLGLLNSLDAVEATRAEVCSLGVFLVAKMDTFQSSRARKWQAP